MAVFDRLHVHVPSQDRGELLMEVIMRKVFTCSSCLIVVLLLVLALPAVLLGQSYFGTVSGALTDATGAVVQGANAVLKDLQKGFTFAATSDESGRYLFRSIAPGMYSLTVDARGFSKGLVRNIKVDINQNATADLILKVAGAEQTV